MPEDNPSNIIADLAQRLGDFIDSSLPQVLINDFATALDRFDYADDNVVAAYPQADTTFGEWDQQAFDNYYQPDESDPRRTQADKDSLIYPLFTDNKILGIPNLLLMLTPGVVPVIIARALGDSFMEPNSSLIDNLVDLTGATSAIKKKYQRARPAPATEIDPGYTSGHTTIGFLVGTALAWLFPERGQELFSRALNFGESRVVHGSHYPTDTIGSRALSYYESASLLNNENFDQFVVNSAKLARSVLGTLMTPFFFSGDLKNTLETQTTPLADAYAADGDAIGYYGMAAPGAPPGTDSENIPALAANLLMFRFPYLSAAERQDILAGTSHPVDSLAGYMVEPGDPDSYWALVDLPNAYRGPAELDTDITVNQVTTDDDFVGYGDSDTWENNITGTGHLIKDGTGTLTLTGDNDFGGIEVNDGRLVLTGDNQLDDTLYVNGGVLIVDGDLDANVVLNGGTLAGSGTIANLTVESGTNDFTGTVDQQAAEHLVADSAALGAPAGSSQLSYSSNPLETQPQPIASALA